MNGQEALKLGAALMTLLAGLPPAAARAEGVLKKELERVEQRVEERLAATPFTSEELARRTVHRHAVDAVIWGLPLVGEETVRQAYFCDGKANYNDIVWWPKRGGNTKVDGPKGQGWWWDGGSSFYKGPRFYNGPCFEPGWRRW